MKIIVEGQRLEHLRIYGVEICVSKNNMRLTLYILRTPEVFTEYFITAFCDVLCDVIRDPEFLVIKLYAGRPRYLIFAPRGWRRFYLYSQPLNEIRGGGIREMEYINNPNQVRNWTSML